MGRSLLALRGVWLAGGRGKRGEEKEGERDVDIRRGRDTNYKKKR